MRGLVCQTSTQPGLIEWPDNGVQALLDANLLPLLSVIVEPAKVLFLNNVINHGVFAPLGS